MLGLELVKKRLVTGGSSKETAQPFELQSLVLRVYVLVGMARFELTTT